MSCNHHEVGDRGQRYEVRFYDRRDGSERVMGWTDARDGGKLLKAASLWPTARDPFVIDRDTGEILEPEKNA